MINLTGTWAGGDTLTYQFTQVGNVLFIRGDKDNLHNVGFGTIEMETNLVILQWADTPDSSGFGHKGVLLMEIIGNNQLSKKGGSASFGIGNFTR